MLVSGLQGRGRRPHGRGAALATAVRNPFGSLRRRAPSSSFARAVGAAHAAYQEQSRCRMERLITWQRVQWAQWSRHSAAALSHVSVPSALSFHEPREPVSQLPSPNAVAPQWPGCARANHSRGSTSEPARLRPLEPRRCLHSGAGERDGGRRLENFGGTLWSLCADGVVTLG